MGPCVGLALVDPEQKVSLLAHVTPINSEVETIVLIEKLLARNKSNIYNAHFVLAGGQNHTSNGIIEQATNLKSMLISKGARCVADLTGEVADRLRISADKLVVTVTTKGDKIEQNFCLK